MMSKNTLEATPEDVLGIEQAQETKPALKTNRQTTPGVKRRIVIRRRQNAELATNQGALSAETICDMALRQGIQCFRNQHDEYFAWVRIALPSSHFECMGLKSKRFRRVLRTLAAGATGQKLRKSVLKEAVELLEQEADDAPEREIHPRFAEKNNSLFIDLADGTGRAIKVNPQGWNEITLTAPLFSRYPHQKSLPMPVGGADPYELFNHVPVEDEQSQLLILGWMCSALHPSQQTPILNFIGPQSAAKSTLCRRLRALLDPSVVDLLGEYGSEDLPLLFSQHAIPVLENVSGLSNKSADTFCKAVTGTGFTRRRKYSDVDMVIHSYQRSIIINGISLPSRRNDFLDRCLVIECKKLERCQSLSELDKAFHDRRPQILGALLDLLTKTLRIYNSITAPDDTRFPDFARFGRAVAVSLDKSKEEFDEAYRFNRRQLGLDLIDSCPLAQLITMIVNSNSAQLLRNATAREIFDTLSAEDKVRKVTRPGNRLTKSLSSLSTKLHQLAPTLLNEGIVIEELKRTSSRRRWDIYRQPQEKLGVSSELTDLQQELVAIYEATPCNQENNHSAFAICEIAEWEELAGNGNIVTTIVNLLNKESRGAMYLAGPSGSGKSTLINQAFRLVACQEPRDNNPCGKCKGCKGFTVMEGNCGLLAYENEQGIAQHYLQINCSNTDLPQIKAELGGDCGETWP